MATSRMQLSAEAAVASSSSSYSALKGWGGMISSHVVKQNMEQLQWRHPTKIQRSVISLILANKNVIASAPSGTGKTGAYVLPLLEHHLRRLNQGPLAGGKKSLAEPTSFSLLKLSDAELDKLGFLGQAVKKGREEQQRLKGEKGDSKSVGNEAVASGEAVGKVRPDVLVLVPTGELGEQVEKVAKQLATDVDQFHIRYLGQKTLSSDTPVTMLIATPGRLLSHLEDETALTLDFSDLKHLVLDECDKLLSLGFLADVLKIRTYLPKPKKVGDTKVSFQTMMFTATLVPEIHQMVLKFASKHELVDLNSEMAPNKNIQHLVYGVSPMRKLGLLCYFLHRKGKVTLKDKQIIVFVRTKDRGERVAEYLQEQGFKACYIHSDTPPTKRRAFLEEFRNGHLKILVATDMLSRGIDLPEVECVVNLDLPVLPEDYVHRIGRTGRAGNKGLALSFFSTHTQVMNFGNKEVLRNEEEMLEKIEALIGEKLELRSKVPGPWVDQPGVKGSTAKGYYDAAGVWVERNLNEEPEEYPGWIPNEKLQKEREKQEQEQAGDQDKEKTKKKKKKKSSDDEDEEHVRVHYDEAMKEATRKQFLAQGGVEEKRNPKVRLSTKNNEIFAVDKKKAK